MSIKKTSAKLNFDQKRRLKIIKSFSLIGLFFLSIFSFTSFIDKYYVLASGLMVLNSLIIINFILFYRLNKFRSALLMTTFIIVLLYLFLLVTGGKENSGYIWCLALLSMIIFLLGHIYGTITLAILFCISAAFLLIPGFGIMTTKYTHFIKTRFLMTFCAIAIVSIAFEFARFKSQQKYQKAIKKRGKIREKMLKRMAKQKTNFFVNLAHETKTPLTLIKNYLEKFIRKNGITKELEIIQYNLEKLTDDMVNFLDYEKLKRNKIVYDNFVLINLSDFLKNKITLFKEITKQKKPAIKIKNRKKHIYKN